MAASFGEQLRLAREAKGISLREISEQTRISMRYLEAIEADDYKRLPGGIFNKSFIKSYAKYIGFDEKQALEGYARTVREQGGSPDEVMSTPYQPHVYTDSGSSRSPIVTALLSALILAVLILGVYAAQHWYQRRADKATNNPATTAQPAQQANPSTPAAPTATTMTSSPATAVATNEFRILITARGESVWISATEDDKSARAVTLKPGVPEVFNPEQQLKIGYDKTRAKSLEVSINGRRVAVPVDKNELLITKDNYAQLVQ